MAQIQEDEESSFLTIDEIKTEPPDFDFISIDEGQLTSSITVKEEEIEAPTIKQEQEIEEQEITTGPGMTRRSSVRLQIKRETLETEVSYKITRKRRAPTKLADRKPVVKRVVTETEYQCDKCFRYCNSIKNLKRHINRVHEKYVKRIRCKYCHKRMKHELHRTLHEKYVHAYNYNTGKFQCEECDKILDSRRRLINHVNLIHVQHSEHPFICDICKLESKNKITLRAHICKYHIIMTGNNRPKCKYCNARFKYRKQLKNHYRVLTCINLLPIKCEYCSRMLKNENTLSNHIWQYHTGSQAGKIFKCIDCDRKYMRKSDLAKHLRDAHQSRPKEKHKCKYCKSYFKARNILNAHIKFKHKIVDIFQCELCEKSYVRPYHLKRHMKEAHESQERDNKYCCQNCQVSFPNKLALSVHMSICGVDTDSC